MELKTWFPLLPKRLLLRYTIYWYLLPSVTSYQMHAWWLYGQANASCHLQRNFWHGVLTRKLWNITYTYLYRWNPVVFVNWKYVSPLRTSCNYLTNAVSKYLKFNIQTTFFCFVKFDHCSLINGGGCEPVCGNVIPSCIQYGARLWHVFTLRETWWCMESI